MWKQFRILALASLGALGIAAAAGLVWFAERSGGAPVRAAVPAPSPAHRPAAPVAAAMAAPADDPVEGVARRLTTAGCAAAAKQAVNVADRESRLQCLLAVVAAWTDLQPLEAVRFASSLPAGAERREVLAEVLARWSARDVAAASIWLEGRESDEDLDGALAIGATLARGEPDIALAWAGRINDPGIRWETIRAVVQDWATRDESAATLYAREIPGLSPEQRGQLGRRIAQQTRLLD